jgi:hypothetical protein
LLKRCPAPLGRTPRQLRPRKRGEVCLAQPSPPGRDESPWPYEGSKNAKTKAREKAKRRSKNRKTKVRERVDRIKLALGEYAKASPAIDFKASLDSLEMMEGVMRHFYFRALIERSVGEGANWDKVDALMLKNLAAAEKVARYKHAQLSAVRLAGSIDGKMEDVSMDDKRPYQSCCQAFRSAKRCRDRQAHEQ